MAVKNLGMEEKLMEQLNVMTQQDNEKVFRILSDLLTKDKEFQIMITVPAGTKLTNSENSLMGKRQTAGQSQIPWRIHMI